MVGTVQIRVCDKPGDIILRISRGSYGKFFINTVYEGTNYTVSECVEMLPNTWWRRLFIRCGNRCPFCGETIGRKDSILLWGLCRSTVLHVSCLFREWDEGPFNAIWIGLERDTLSKALPREKVRNLRLVVACMYVSLLEAIEMVKDRAEKDRVEGMVEW